MIHTRQGAVKMPFARCCVASQMTLFYRGGRTLIIPPDGRTSATPFSTPSLLLPIIESQICLLNPVRFGVLFLSTLQPGSRDTAAFLEKRNLRSFQSGRRRATAIRFMSSFDVAQMPTGADRS